MSQDRETLFMNELDAALHQRPSFASNVLLYAITALLVLFMIWSSAFTIDEIVRGQGQVIPTQEIQIVQSLEGGLLSELLVMEGERVEKGQVLMRISDVTFASEERGMEARNAGLITKQARLQAEIAGEDFIPPEGLEQKYPDIVKSEADLYLSRQEELANAQGILDERIARVKADLAEARSQINRYSESRRLLSEELEITKSMVRQRAMPKLEEIRLTRELSDVRGQLNGVSERKKGLEADLRAAEQERADQDDKFRSQALGELSEVNTRIAELSESLKSAEDRVFRTELRAPVEGIVNKVTIKTIGGVIEPAMRLAEIVPIDDSLKITAKVRPNDVAFLQVGQPVKVAITAYDSQRYGRLDGELVRIGANSITDNEGNIFFEIEVRTARNYLETEGKKLPITPGMVAEVSVVTGERTILSYLARPFLRLKDKAFTER